MNTPALFSGDGLCCRRGGRTVFANLDFTVAAGEALLLTGPNGSGKSSLLRLMAGLIQPAAGALSYEGGPIEDEEAHRARLHYIGHLDAVKPALTSAENLRFWAGLHGAGAVAEGLAAFGLTHLADLPGRYLSAGQRRRLALARLVAAPVRLWLLDEPSVGLDGEALGRLDAALTRHFAGGGAAIIATHAPIAAAKRELRVGDYAISPGAAEAA